MEDVEIKAWILYKLKRKGCWGKGHLSDDNLAKGQSRELKKRILRIADELVTEGYLVKFPHGKEKHYYLNKEFREEINNLIDEYTP
ncbi:MAG: hypothetical protein KAU03_01100 [Candidatus Altiarchaeales archaeon]|nr:hypothetical protein [Candidatus Altiarchaeales archaeon]